MMKQQIVIIHGGNAFDSYKKYLADLKRKKLDLERLTKVGWKDTLAERLGEEFEVLRPEMPNKMNAKYIEWKIWFDKFKPFIKHNAIFIGHSLGGIFLARYLSENKFPKKIKATLLVAAPYNTKKEHPLADFIITKKLDLFAKQGGEIIMYHSKDDNVVKFSNYKRYQEALPEARAVLFFKKGHFNQEEFPELITDIRSLA
jgi:predicted alpha/beta hydrolase family esterase